MAEKISQQFPDFVFKKINDRKLNGDNFLQWKRVIEIHTTGSAKDHTTWLMTPQSKDADLEAEQCTTSRTNLEQHRATYSGSGSTL